MKNSGRRAPFDHVKEIYGENLEKYSYQEMTRDPELRKELFQKKKKSKDGYETIRGKILDVVILIFIFFMLGVGVYFIFNAMIEA